MNHGYSKLDISLRTHTVVVHIQFIIHSYMSTPNYLYTCIYFCIAYKYRNWSNWNKKMLYGFMWPSFIVGSK